LDGEPLDGVFSHSSVNAVSFGAKAPLLADTTYEVVILKDGLKDLAQNPIAEETVTRFSTGATIQEPVGGGGSAGTGGGGTSTSGASTGGSSAGTTMSGSGSGGSPVSSGGSAVTAAGTPSDDVQYLAEERERGCGCSLPGHTRNHTGWLLSALFAFATVVRAGRRAPKRGTIRP
jgi:hypothetical protein